MNEAEWLHWISPDNTAQHEWACTYLSNKGLLRAPDTPFAEVLTPHGLLIRTAREWPINDQTRKLVKRMRGAWSQEKFRRTRHGKKGYNFVLSHKARRNLKQLAKERPATITETLEILIDDVNAQLKLHKAQNHKANERRDMGYAKLRKEGEQLRIAALEIWAQLDSCLLEISKLSSATLGSTAELAEEVSRHYIERKARVIENLTTAKLLRLIPH